MKLQCILQTYNKIEVFNENFLFDHWMNTNKEKNQMHVESRDISGVTMA